MTLYDIDGDKLKPSKIDFDRESKIQSLTQNNLEELFNLKVIQAECEYKGLRIDTLAFDNETKSFVIIEYKNKLECSVIDQGFSYLALVINNKEFFIRKYNAKNNTHCNCDDFDFNHTKIMIIAPNFTKYQKRATEFVDLPIELWKVKLYENGCVSYDKITQDSANSIKEVITDNKNIKIDLKTLNFTEEDLLINQSLELNRLYYNLKERLLFKFDDLDIEFFKTLVSYKVNNQIISTLHFNPKSLTMRLFTKAIDDPENRTTDLSTKKTGGSTVNYSINLKSEEDFDYFITLFEQIYNEKRLQ